MEVESETEDIITLALRMKEEAMSQGTHRVQL